MSISYSKYALLRTSFGQHKMVCVGVFPHLKQDTFWYSFMFILCFSLVKRKRWLVHVTLELRHYSKLSPHIKELQNSIYCLNFLKITIWKGRLWLIPKVTGSVLSVGALSVSSLLHNVFFTVWERNGLSDQAKVTKVFAKCQLCKKQMKIWIIIDWISWHLP